MGTWQKLLWEALRQATPPCPGSARPAPVNDLITCLIVIQG